MALNFQPDLMLSDVVMPGITGVEAALQVRAKLPSCKILLFSGQAATAACSQRLVPKTMNSRYSISPFIPATCSPSCAALSGSVAPLSSNWPPMTRRSGSELFGQLFPFPTCSPPSALLSPRKSRVTGSTNVPRNTARFQRREESLQEKSVNSSLGETESAFANFTIFSNATFRSPRSTPPT